MTLQQIKQVSITYLARPTGRGWAVILGWAMLTAMSIGVMASGPVEDSDDALGILLSILFGCVFPFAALNKHLQWQLASPRARLTPDYTAPHFAVWTGGCALSLTAMPVVIAVRAGASAWAAVALAAVGAVVVVKPNVVWLLLVPFFLPTEFHAAAMPWLHAEGYRALALAAVTAAAWLVLWRHAQRLTAWTEDRATFAAPVWDAADHRSARPFRQAKAAVSFMGRLLLPPYARQDGSLWKVLFTFQAPTRMEVALTTWQCAATAVPLILFAYVGARQDDGSVVLNREVWSNCMKLLGGITFFAAAIPAVRLAEHVPRMAAERLLPFTNRRYVDLLLLGGAKAGVAYWLAAHLAALVVTYLVPWEGVELDPRNVAVYVAMSLAGLLLTYATAVCCAAYSGVIPLFIAVIVGVVAIVGLQAYWITLNDFEGHGVVPFWIVVFGIAAAATLLRARVLWREREIG